MVRRQKIKEMVDTKVIVSESVAKQHRMITEQQFEFMPGRSTADAIFCLRMLLEKWT